jgi:hypothetical protein
MEHIPNLRGAIWRPSRPGDRAAEVVVLEVVGPMVIQVMAAAAVLDKELLL